MLPETRIANAGRLSLWPRTEQKPDGFKLAAGRRSGACRNVLLSGLARHETPVAGILSVETHAREGVTSHGRVDSVGHGRQCRTTWASHDLILLQYRG